RPSPRTTTTPPPSPSSSSPTPLPLARAPRASTARGAPRTKAPLRARARGAPASLGSTCSRRAPSRPHSRIHPRRPPHLRRGALEVRTRCAKARVHHLRIEPRRLPDLDRRHLFELRHHEDDSLLVFERVEERVDDPRRLGALQRFLRIVRNTRIGDGV